MISHVEGTLNLAAGVPQYSEEINFPVSGFQGLNSLQLDIDANTVAVDFEVTGDGVFPATPMFTAVVVAAHTGTDKVLYQTPSTPLAVRGRYVFTASGGPVVANYRTNTL